MPKIDKDYADKWLEEGVSINTRTIYLGSINSNDSYDETDEEPGIYWNTARRLIKGIHLLDSNAQDGNKPITIIMNSCGGTWEMGMAIYNAIKYAKNHVTVINMSHARSMTSLIFQAADYRITSPDGLYMIHDGNTAHYNTPKTVFNWVDYEKTIIHPRMYQIYLNRLQERNKRDEPIVDIEIAAEILNAKLPKGAVKVNPKKGVEGITLEHISQLCSQDTIFTAEEMIKLNFADRLLESNDLSGAYANGKMLGLPTGLESLEETDEDE